MRSWKRTYGLLCLLFAGVLVGACGGGGGGGVVGAPAPPAGALDVFVSPDVAMRFASLDNAQETTGSDSTGIGGGFIAVNTVTGQVSGFLVHNIADAQSAHIHVGARGIAGGIVIELTPDNTATTTVYTVPDNTFLPNPVTDVPAFLAGNLYFNVHNAAFPGGVIRGQLDMEPTTIRFASLDNTQETTGSNSAGIGGGIIGIDEVTGQVMGFAVHNVADGNRAHIHPGARGIAGGIAVPMLPDNVVSPVFVVPDGAVMNLVTDVPGFLAGNTYINIHNAAFPGGVIRGQLDMEPTVMRFASLDNAQETTGSDSTGKGGGVVGVNEATGRVAGFAVHNVADGNRAHIHPGARGIAGGIAVPMLPDPLVSPVFAVPDGALMNLVTDVPAFLAGTMYINVHSAAFPGGVIRGQLDQN
ncbi:MAG: CHRD domain-containing protein [Thermodesulfobacteriota bacterium]